VVKVNSKKNTSNGDVVTKSSKKRQLSSEADNSLVSKPSKWTNDEDSIDVDASISSDVSLIKKNKVKSKTSNDDTPLASAKKGKKRSLNDSNDASVVFTKIKKRNLGESEMTGDETLSDKKKTKKTNVNINAFLYYI